MRPRCSEHGLALDDAGRCLVCRKNEAAGAREAPKEPGSRRPFVFWSLFGGVLLAGGAAAFGFRAALFESPTARALEPERAEAARPAPSAATSSPSSAEPPSPAAAPPLEGTLRVTNHSGRSGSYLVPQDTSRRLPVLLAFHGSGSSGAAILAPFRQLALARGFVIVAPDSGFVPDAGTFTWYVGSQPGETSPDSPHVSAALEEVLELVRAAHPELRLAAEGWLAVGFSGGGSSAPFRASHDPRFSHYAVLHGGVFPGGLGPLLPRGWFSTGEADTLRPPAQVSEHARAAARVFGESLVELHVYPGAHTIPPEEAAGVVRFWLGE